MVKLKLLSRKYRWIPYALIAFAIASTVILNILTETDKQLLKEFTFSLFNIALLMIFLTKQKSEDEMFVQFRLVYAMGGLIVGLMFTFFNAFTALCGWEWDISEFSAGRVLTVVLLFTNLMFWWHCQKMQRENNNEE